MKKVFKGVFTVLTVIAFAAYLLFLWLTVLQFQLKLVPQSGLVVSDIFLSVCTAVVAVIGFIMLYRIVKKEKIGIPLTVSAYLAMILHYGVSILVYQMIVS